MMNNSQLGLLILALALLVFLFSRLIAKRSGLPDGKLIYSDNEAFQQLPKPLYDRDLKLVGKPDYVIALKDGTIVPVEFKSQNAPVQPYDSHILQLYAYCYLSERTYGRRPPYGLIQYADKTFQIDYDKAHEDGLLELVAEIRRCETFLAAPDRSHEQPARCRSCGYSSSCDQKF